MDTILTGSEQNSLSRSQAARVKRSLTDQIEQEMYRAKLNKNVLANRMGTSRAAVQRLLDPDNVSVTLGTLERVALALNMRLKIEFS
jgi:DNA-binding Xre family transcriptional regulator